MNQLLLEFKKIDQSILSLVKFCMKFSSFISIISIVILLTYDFVYTSPTVFYVGISLFRTSLFFMAFIVIYGFAFSKLKKDLK